MSITRERKSEVIKEYQRAAEDTGSPEVQIAVLSHRVRQLTDHLKGHMKDHAGRRGLLMMVSRRRRLLDFLKSTQPATYYQVIDRLGLRK